MAPTKRPLPNDSEERPWSSSKSLSVVPSKQNSGYVEGAIVRIKLTKFLTYDEVEFRTGPHLNVIMGPNGTGKSAIVCAMCLGLAGKPKWLGRATDPREYIKYGAESAEIEIELFNPYVESNYLITRGISHSKSSHWTINKKTTTLKAVEDLVLKLNIQVGNLCQFLPQEKVAEFARMSTQELLENTEKSVCRDDLYENHQKLKSARHDSRGMEENLREIQEELDQKRQRTARLEQDVKSYHDRKTFLEKVEVLKLKKPWLEYNMLLYQSVRAQKEKNTKDLELKHEREQTESLQRQNDELKAAKDKDEHETRQMSKTVLAKTKNVEEQKAKLVSMTEKMDQENNEFNSKLKEEEARKKKLAALQGQLASLEQQLSNLNNGNDEQEININLGNVVQSLTDVNAQQRRIQIQVEELAKEISSVKNEIGANEARLSNIRNVNNRRLETLRTLHQHTYEALVWLRENKELFKHTIHEPMIISLNVTNRADAKLVESLISFNDLRSFVCEDPDDLDLFMRKMKNEQRLRVNAVRAPPQAASSFKPQHPISYYKEYGFQRYMQDLFTCPEPVMRYLCLMYKVHHIPVGTAAVKKKLEHIAADCPELNNYYTPDIHYTAKRSKYNNIVGHKNTALREPRALADSVNVELEKELIKLTKESREVQKTKEDECKVLHQQSDDLLKEIEELREQKRILMKRKEERKDLETQIKTKKQKIQFISAEELNLDTEKHQLQIQLKAIVKEKLEILEKIKSLCADCIRLAKARIEGSLKLTESVRRFKVVEAELRKAKQKYEGLEREVQELKEHVDDTKQQTRDKKAEAMRVAGIDQQDDLEKKLAERGVLEDFKKAPTELSDLESEIYSMQAKADSMFMVDEQVVRDYEQGQKEIKKLEKDLMAERFKHQSHNDNIQEIKTKWNTDLRKLIEEINQNFSNFFSRLECVGEVSLSVPENPEDYEKYGVCIKVKFRDHENLQELTAHHQSGGERSVSTVLFMMSLQELTKCPFRCVDEINQGMDPKNERKIFELVVQTVKESSQYFLLTPKLLPHLVYDDNVTVLCVYNGPNMIDHRGWNLQNFLRRRAALEV